MDSPLGFLPFILFIVVLAVIFILVRAREKKRAEAWRLFGQQNGLQFVENDRETPKTFRAFSAFNQGHSHRVRFRLTGTVSDTYVSFLDHHYTTGSGKNQQQHAEGVLLVRLPAAYPRLKIVPENIGHKIADALGAEDIDFESDEFSRKFWVTSDDRKFAYDVIHPRTMEYLMTAGWERWEIVGDFLCLWDPRRPQVADFRRTVDRALSFVRLFPKHVMSDHTRVAQAPPAPTWSAFR